MDENHIKKINAKFDAMYTYNGKFIVLLPFIKDKLGDILTDAESPNFNQDLARAKFIASENGYVMFSFVKPHILHFEIFLNKKSDSKEFDIRQISEMRTYLLDTYAKFNA